MIKISNCKELNYFEHYNILTNIDNKQIDSMLSIINNKTVKLISNKRPDNYIIIHRCTKDTNLIQCSYFDSKGAYSDIVRPTYKDIIKNIDYRHYIIVEVI